MTIHRATNGDIEIAYETFGAPDGVPLLLVTGQGGQMLDWPVDFCGRLVARGFRVTRFDNRDSGLSTRLTAAGTPNRLRMLLRPASAAGYRLEDMADDAVAVLDAAGYPAAHVVGTSMGGMIAQTLAVRHPDRVRTLTSISATPAPRTGQPGPVTLLRIIRAANPARVRARDDLGRYLVGLQRLVGSPAYPADEEELLELGRQCFDRGGLDMAALQRQTAAIAASGDRRAALAGVRAPTLVLHGEDDPLVRIAAGRATAAAVPGARLVTYPGMGHDLPRQLWPAIVDEIATLAGLAATPAPSPVPDVQRSSGPAGRQ